MRCCFSSFCEQGDLSTRSLRSLGRDDRAAIIMIGGVSVSQVCIILIYAAAMFVATIFVLAELEVFHQAAQR